MPRFSIPAHEVTVETDSALRKLLFVGDSARFFGHAGRHTWVHSALPSFVIIGDRRQKLREITLRFRAGAADAWIGAFHLYDGERRILAFDGLFATSKRWLERRFPVSTAPDVHWGLGVSLKLVFHHRREARNDADAWRFDLGASSVLLEAADR